MRPLLLLSLLFSCNLIVLLTRCVRGQLLILPLVSENTEVVGSFECPCADIAYGEYDPTCGTNGVTYINPESLYCDQKCQDPKLSVAYKGACKVEAWKLQNLTEEYDDASAYKSNTRITTQCNCVKSSEYRPICGSNGHTYQNYAELQCERKCRKIKISIKYYGLCREDEYFRDTLPFLTDALARCACGYTEERDPVCGTDGYTYPNPSMLLCVTNCNNPSLQIVHFGECRKDQRPHNFGAVRLGCDCRSTSRMYRPLCADNGITYDNLALFYCAQQCLNRQFTILGEHPCREKWDVDERSALHEYLEL